MSRRLALPDIDPSVALAQAARQDLEREFLAHRHRIKRVAFISAPGRWFAELLKPNISAQPDASARRMSGPLKA
jgi:hypothetical protein